MNHSPLQDPALLAAARARFAGDRYATEVTGCEIAAVTPGYARCRMAITPAHRNALGIVMGGAIFTLADFTFAVPVFPTRSPSTQPFIISPPPRATP